MRQLLDTNALLWFVWGDSKRISPGLKARIEVGAMVSIASFWEIAIKKALGKLQAPDDLPTRVQAMGFELLAIELEHAWALHDLPQHHRDPFDRLLIAQARIESLVLLTADPAFDAYDVDVAWG